MGEREPLLGPVAGAGANADVARLSLPLATLCVVDLLGVLPVIALPRAIAECGWLGVPLALAVFAVQMYTALLLGRCWIIAEGLHPDVKYSNRYPYAALSELSFGRRFGKFVTVLLDVCVFGGSVPTLIVAAQNLQLLGLKTSSWEFDFSYCYWALILGICLCPLTWLGTTKDTKWVTTLSVLMVTSTALLVWVCLLATGSTWYPIPLPAPGWESVAISYGVLAFQFDIHPSIPGVQMGMERKDQIGYAILGGFFVTGGLALMTTVITVGRYGAAARANLLQGFTPSYPLYIAVLLATAQLCLALALSAARCFSDLEDKLGMPQAFGWRRAVLRSALVGVTVLVAEGVPRFDLLMALVGGMLMGPLMFLLPPLLYVRLRTLQDRARHIPPLDYQGTEERIDVQHNVPPIALPERSWLLTAARRFLSLEGATDEGPLSAWEMALTGAVVLVGIAASLAATYFSVKKSITVAKYVPSCLQF